MNEFTWPVRVYYEDTDLAGIVYYANYLRYLERARTEWLRALGCEQDRLKARDNLVFVVAAADLRFVRPARFNDVLEVGVRMRRLRRASIELDQPVRRAEVEVLRATVRVACIDAQSLRPRGIPRELSRSLSSQSLSSQILSSNSRS